MQDIYKMGKKKLKNTIDSHNFTISSFVVKINDWRTLKKTFKIQYPIQTPHWIISFEYSRTGKIMSNTWYSDRWLLSKLPFSPYRRISLSFLTVFFHNFIDCCCDGGGGRGAEGVENINFASYIYRSFLSFSVVIFLFYFCNSNKEIEI